MAKAEKSKKKDKSKGSKKKGAADGISVAGHPRAADAVRRAKGFGGIAFFFLTAYLSHKANVPITQVALRALAGGIAGYLLAWACAVQVWRQIVLAELRAAIENGQATMSPPAASPRQAPEPEPALQN